MYSLSPEHQILFDERVTGPADHIIIDVYQKDVVKLVPKEPDTVKAKLKVGDYVLATKSHIVVVEEKRILDLLRSYQTRRLQRQLRRMRLANPQGINILGLRASGTVPGLAEILWLDVPGEMVLDLLKWQATGGLIGLLPHSPSRVLEELRNWRAILKPGQHLYSVLSGSDQERMPEKMTEVGYALRRLFKGVGPKLGTAWADASGQSLTKALRMSDSEIKRLGARQPVLDKRKELQ